MELNTEKRNLNLHLTAKEESDTYDIKTRDKKEVIPAEDVMKHWDIRAQRQDIQAVMSTRYTLEQNKESTDKFLKEIFSFLGDKLEGKKIFEVGVGVGRILTSFAKVAKEVVGCDISPTMVEKAEENLKEFENTKLYLNKVANVNLPSKYFDLAFTSTVLQHILDPKELDETANKMMELSDEICIIEHTYQGPDFPISKYTILRNPDEYEKLFAPYKLMKQQYYFCSNDRLNMMFFQKV
ncbi:MAG: class I SAM-dependent methyltransferase [Parcubacteria group bacterium]|nr:class I SAM-dependent methyltransferase [Parcubacteria group bacterium]